MGIQLGDELVSTSPTGKAIKLKVAALWQPVNANDSTWIFIPKFFDEVLLVQPSDLAGALASVDKPIEESAWYILFDGSQLRTSSVDGLLGRVVDGQRDVETGLPGIRLDQSPVDALTKFSIEVNALTQQPIIMVLPVAVLVLYFVAIVAGLLVSRQQTENLPLPTPGLPPRSTLPIPFLLSLIFP